MWHFGFLAGFLWPWFLWILLSVFGVIGVWTFTRGAAFLLMEFDERERRRYDGNPFPSVVFGLLLVLGVVHLGGIFDVVTYVRDHVKFVLLGVAAYCVFGFVYMLLKGAVRVIRARRERISALLEVKRGFIADRRERERAAFDAAKAEVDAQAYIASHPLSKPIQVSQYKMRMLTWALLWLPDLLCHTVFKFFDRLKDAWDIIWNGIKSSLQNGVNRYWGNLSEAVKRAEVHDRSQ